MKPRIPPPIVTLIAAALMWALHRWVPMSICFAAPWNLLGVLPALAGIATAAAAVRRFRRAQTTTNPLNPGKASHLVTDGVFRFSRNPMYLGLTLFLTGWAIWLGTASPWFIVPLFVIFITVAQIRPEEQALGQIFGEEYADYRRHVSRWIGRAS
ncbi:isoprenylcysteine carboxylmethyltransferase family protein [Paraburkholderia sp.]|uniref:methyltransferase family protein n=1 Tax=Paraburkholderia sp. TaxID=1926495 RepID=UPI0025E18B5A|nr:isoprenylcysteine carboxylmethyltransferase family protein [Paraburkholderia sp.]